MTTTIKISSNGQVVVPAEIRRRLGVRPGDLLQVRLEGGVIRLEPVPNWQTLFGSVGRRGRKPPSTTELEGIRRRRALDRHRGE